LASISFDYSRIMRRSCFAAEHVGNIKRAMADEHSLRWLTYHKVDVLHV